MGERAVVTVMGQDKVGIVAGITRVLADYQCNILDISQTILQDIFAMILMVQLPPKLDLSFLREELEVSGRNLGVKVTIQHEDIFRFMHRI